MRIHAIRVHNLTSLHGTTSDRPHVLDLDGDLGAAPIFLIRGPTGAGKSTLLDAITLALFGRTARLGSTTATAGDDGDLDEGDARRVMAHGCGECFAEVDFSFAGAAERTAYRARWTVWRARRKADGPLQKPVRSLWRLDRPGGAPVETLVEGDKKVDIATAFGRVLGTLGFEDFTRSVMLAQGDFQAFLKANDAERAALLARLTDATVYARMGRAAADKRRQSRARVESLEAKAAAVMCLDAGARAALETALADTQAAAEARRHEVLQLETRLKAAEGLAHTLRILQGAREARQACEAAILAYSADAERLELHQAAERVWPLVTASDAAAQAWQTREGTVAALEAARPDVQAAQALAEAGLQAAEGAARAAAALAQNMRGPIQAARDAEQGRKEKARQTALAETQLEDAVTRAKAAMGSAQAAETAWRESVATVERLEQQLASWGAAGDLVVLKTSVEDAAGVWVRAAKKADDAARARRDADKALEARESALKVADDAARAAATGLASARAGLAGAEAALGALVVADVADVPDVADVADATGRVLEARVTAANQAVAGAVDAAGAVRELLEVRGRLARAEADQAAARVAADETGRAVEASEAAWQQAETQRERWRLDVEAAERVREIVRRRAVLVADEPCPLCGGTEHPYRRDPALAPSTAAQDRHVAELEAIGAELKAAGETAQRRVKAARGEREKALAALADATARVEAGLAAVAAVEARAGVWLTAARQEGLVESISVAMIAPEHVDAVVAVARERLGAATVAVDLFRRAWRARDEARSAVQMAELAAQAKREARESAEVAVDEARTAARGSAEHQELENGEAARALGVLRARLGEAGRALAEDATPAEADAAVKAVIDAASAWQKVRDALALARDAVVERQSARDVARTAAEAAEAAVVPVRERLAGARHELQTAERAVEEAWAALGGEAPEALEARLDRALEAALKVEGHARTRAQAAVAAAADIATRLASAVDERDKAAEALTAAARARDAALAAGGWLDVEAVRSARLPAAEAAQLKAAGDALAERDVATRTGLELAARAHAGAVVEMEAHAGAVAEMAAHAEAVAEMAAHAGAVMGEAVAEVGGTASDWAAWVSDGAAIGAFVAQVQAARVAAQAAWENARAAEGGHRAALAQDDRHRAEGLAYAETLAAAREEAGLWEVIHKLIGGNDGAEFVKLAQAFHLDDLCQRANARLKRLSPRYRLAVKREASGLPTLAFVVLDADQADRPRPPSTLSGGETFIVSLALALALADFRAVSVPIETVLIDEGFGTLDPQTLGTVIATLESLHAATGSQIGIISHVAMLAERIPARVHVRPVGQGRSELVVEC